MARVRPVLFWKVVAAGMLLTTGCVSPTAEKGHREMAQHMECMKEHPRPQEAPDDQGRPAPKCAMMKGKTAAAIADPAGHVHGDSSASSGKEEQHE
jgi:hypothetical protein